MAGSDWRMSTLNVGSLGYSGSVDITLYTMQRSTDLAANVAHV